MITARALIRGQGCLQSNGAVGAKNDPNRGQIASTSYDASVEEGDKTRSDSMTSVFDMRELSTDEIQALRARIEEKSGLKRYDYGNSWAKLV